MTIDEESEKLGYILGVLEAIKDKQDEDSLRQSKIEDRIKSLEDALKEAVIVYKVMRFLIVLIITIVTFKWGNIGEVWSYFKHG